MNDERYFRLLKDGDRFWSLVDKEPDSKGCWVFFGTIHKSGYGHFKSGGNNVIASRAAWILTNGQITSNQWVCHKCDNRACCNPSHHFLGDAVANVADMMAKGRHCSGLDKSKIMLAAFRELRKKDPDEYRRTMAKDSAAHGKLDEDSIKYIRESPLSSLRIAPFFEVDSSTIRKIRRNVTWKSVPTKNVIHRPTGRISNT